MKRFIERLKLLYRMNRLLKASHIVLCELAIRDQDTTTARNLIMDVELLGSAEIIANQVDIMHNQYDRTYK